MKEPTPMAAVRLLQDFTLGDGPDAVVFPAGAILNLDEDTATLLCLHERAEAIREGSDAERH